MSEFDLHQPDRGPASWTTLDLMLMDRDRYCIYASNRQAMNTAISGIPRAFSSPAGVRQDNGVTSFLHFRFLWHRA